MSCSLGLVSPSNMVTRIMNPHQTSPISTRPCNLGTLISTSSRTRRRLNPCKATPPDSSSITEFDLYELLGIDSSSEHPEIKKAYRNLQKRCHPDIAGAAVGHDMAIILNEAYALLSDPISRSAYDMEQAKMAEMRGYTGNPVYSAWFGPESEQRAVFVDEVKCVGCLKCALFASKTFAIESVYGRARVVAQWADPQNVIQEAIDACPVNCISTVERSELPALEFMMSKQPRGSVRIGVGNTVGARVTDVFTEAKVFQRKLESNKKKQVPSGHSLAPDSQRERRMSAVQAILSISSWLYQRPLNGGSSSSSAAAAAGEALILINGLKSASEPRMDKLKMAAAARKLGNKSGVNVSRKTTQLYDYGGGEYWVPTPLLAAPIESGEASDSLSAASSPASSTKRNYHKRNVKDKKQYQGKWPLVWGIPAIGVIAVGMQGGGGGVGVGVGVGVGGGITEHVGGPLAVEIVNSTWLQVGLAGATWYFAALVILSTMQAFVNNSDRPE